MKETFQKRLQAMTDLDALSLLSRTDAILVVRTLLSRLVPPSRFFSLNPTPISRLDQFDPPLSLSSSARAAAIMLLLLRIVAPYL